MRARLQIIAALTVAALALGACAAPQTLKVIESPGDLPNQAQVAAVPFFPQEDYYCGPAALATLLTWSGKPVEPDQIAGSVYTEGRSGTLQNDILAAARRAGRLAVPVVSLRDLMSEIAAGHPVLVLQNLALNWYPQWHYAVAVAYDLENRNVILRSGRIAEHVLAIDTFEHTWRRGGYWALVVLKPDELPQSAGRSAVESAAAALERTGRNQEAATAYNTILKRWPESYAALMGSGNLHHANSEFDAAEAAFRSAIHLQPERPEAWNNLAYVLAAKGQQEEALAAVNKAIELSPGKEEIYLESLRELSQS